MIIKNNFNEKNANPLSGYSSVGKGSHSLDKELENENDRQNINNIDNSVIENENDNDDYDDSHDDKWSFFR